jgi:hypothetical protein
VPAESQKQQMLMGAELARKRAGKATKTGMTEAQLEDFASTKRKGLPMKVKAKKMQAGGVVAADIGQQRPHMTFKQMGIG